MAQYEIILKDCTKLARAIATGGQIQFRVDRLDP